MKKSLKIIVALTLIVSMLALNASAMTVAWTSEKVGGGTNAAQVQQTTFDPLMYPLMTPYMYGFTSTIPLLSALPLVILLLSSPAQASATTAKSLGISLATIGKQAGTSFGSP